MDNITKSILNKKINGIMSGVKSTEVKDTSLVFTFTDGTTSTMSFPNAVGSDGVSVTDIQVNSNKHLLFTFSNGIVKDVGELPQQIASIDTTQIDEYIADKNLLSETDVLSCIDSSETISNLNQSVSDVNNVLFSKVPYDTFKTFPTEDDIKKIGVGTNFNTLGFYNTTDGCGTMYSIISSQNISGTNAMKITDEIYVVPTKCYKCKSIQLKYYGLREGSINYAKTNSNIIDMLYGVNGTGKYQSTTYIEEGNYYFSKPIKIDGYTRTTIIGSGNSTYINGDNSGTTLSFYNLLENESAITTYNSVENIKISGNPENYNCTIDRTKTFTYPDEIASETVVNKTTGITFLNGCNVKNVILKYFYTGIYAPTANFVFEHIYGNKCHTVLSIENDAFCNNIYGWDVMVCLEMRGSLSSANTVRGDSIGEHLVVSLKGGNYLYNLNGDYCVKSLVHIGEKNTWNTIYGGTIIGLYGRYGVYNAFENGTTFDINSVSTENLDSCSAISIENGTRLMGGYFSICSNIEYNTYALDNDTRYCCPNFIITIGKECVVKDTQIVLSSMVSDVTKDYFFKNILRNDNTTHNVWDTKSKVSFSVCGKNLTYEKLIDNVEKLYASTVEELT